MCETPYCGLGLTPMTTSATGPSQPLTELFGRQAKVAEEIFEPGM